MVERSETSVCRTLRPAAPFDRFREERQAKHLHITPPGTRDWIFQGGDEAAAVRYRCPARGILICYDVEFQKFWPALAIRIWTCCSCTLLDRYQETVTCAVRQLAPMPSAIENNAIVECSGQRRQPFTVNREPGYSQLIAQSAGVSRLGTSQSRMTQVN